MHALAPKVPTAGPVQTRIRPRFRFVAAVLLFPFVAAVSISQAQSSSSTGGAWIPVDVGAPLVSGKATETACVEATRCPLFSLSGAGAGVGGTADQFTFLYQRLSGDGAVTVRLLTLSGTSTVEAGVMMRESLAPAAVNTSLLLGTNGGAAFRSRLTASGNTSSTAAPRAGWLRLERAGSKVTASVSVDGAMWTVAAVQTISLPASIYVGIAVTSRTPTSLGTASVANMSVASKTPTLPSGWTSADVGSAPTPGSASYANGSFIATGSGAGFAGASDAFRFVYTRIRGDGKLSTRVAASQGATGWQVGIVLRSTLDPGADEVALLGDEGGLWLVKRPGAAQTAAKTRVATTTVPVMLQLDRRGSMVTASYSTDGATWLPVSTNAVMFGAEIYAGLAVASGSGITGGPTANAGGPSAATTAAAAAAAFDRLSLVSIAANLPPTVSLSSPVNGQTFVQGASVAMAAAASDPDDLVAGVEFRVNGTAVASDSVAPYASSWTPGALGTYTVVAVASDFDGAATTSSPAVITVIAAASGSTSPSGSEPPPANVGGPSAGGPSSSPAPAPVVAPTPAPAPVPAPSTSSWRLEFGASADHASLDHYELEVYLYGLAVSVRSVDIGKPAADNSGICTVDISWIVSALPAGEYNAVVRAVSYGGSTGSAPYSFAR